MSADKGSPVAQWQALSSLYEQACDLDAGARREMLDALAASDPAQHAALQRMLDARDEADADNFLGELPRIELPREPLVPGSREGVRIGPYKLLRRLGAGGMAEVWLGARDDGAFRRQVAIKLPYARLAPGTDDRDGTALARRFDRERDILASLRHPHIAGLIDAGVSDAGEAWLALEYVEGEPIGRWCDTRQSSLRERVRLFRQVLLAVQHAHANLVIHRDLKPANILVTAEGEVRLLDFGIAKLLEGNAVDETELTRLGGSPLTPRYAAPEQLTGATLTTSCDVYALGVVFYELMAGCSPYETKVDTVAAIERAIVESEPRAPSRRALDEPGAQARSTSVKAWRRALAPELDAIALRCLGKTPAQRYSSVDALIADVDRWLGGEAVLARAPGPWARAWKFALRNKVGVGFGLGAVVALVATAGVAVQQGVEARRESARAGAARDFMLELFKRADDEKARGADITARELLDAGRRDVMARLAGQPRLQAELLRGIADIQSEMGEHTHVEPTLTELVRLHLATGERRLAAVALASQALNAVRLNQPARAEELLERGRALHAASMGDHELTARRELARGWIEQSFNRSEPALAAFQKAQAAAAQMSEGGQSLELESGWGVIDALRRLGRLREAEQAHEQLGQRLAGMTEVPRRTIAWNAAVATEFDFQVGRYAKIGATGVESSLRCDRSFGADSELCRRLFLKVTQAQLRLGEVPLPAASVQRLERIASDMTSPFMVFEAASALFRMERQTGQDATRWQGLLLSLSEPGPGSSLNAVFHAYALGLMAEFELQQGAMNAARRRIDLARTELTQSRAASARIEAYVGFLAGVVRIQSADVVGGLDAMRDARARLAGALTPEHPGVAVYDLSIAVAEYRAGSTDRALATWDAAEPAVRSAFGASSRFYRRVTEVREALASGRLPRQGPVQLFL